MATLKLRDRDAIITKEGLVFRVLGYSHPPNAYICDAEYAPAEIFKSDNPKAFRNKRQHVFYKFYEDEGWEEISNTYDFETRIVQSGWTKMLARVVEDRDAPFIPSIYGVEPLKVLNRTRNAIEARRVISYMEEFRMQARKDETIYVEGNLEEVITPKGNFYQIALLTVQDTMSRF